MDTNYTALNNRVNTAIAEHLAAGNILPPNADVPALSRAITEVVFGALKAGGLNQTTIENLGKGTLASVKTQGT
jgi:hypothetical protein